MAFLRKILLSLTVALIFCATNLHALNIPFFGSPVARAYNAALEKEDEEIRQEIFALLGVTINKEQWKEYKKNVAQEDAAKIDKMVTESLPRELPIFSKKTEQTVTELLSKHGLSKTKVSASSPEEIGSYAAAYGTAHNSHIVIAEHKLDAACSTAQSKEGVILHEIMHLKNNDAIENYCLLKLIGQNSEDFSQEKIDALQLLVLKKSRLHEKRADIQAALTDISAAHGLKDFLKNTSPQLNQNATESDKDAHPTDSKRIAYLNGLIAHIKAEHSLGILGKVKASLGLTTQQPVTI